MLKDIMVHMDQTPSCQNRLQVAITLAKQHATSLTGLCVYSSTRQENTEQSLAELREMFVHQTGETGVSAEWLDVDLGFLQTGVAEMIGYYASFTDLLVVGQSLTADRDKQYAAITSPERLLLGSGRPVLIVPSYGSFPRVGERIMVAWKAGPKASRALHDALPLLRSARQVNMVSIGESTFRPGEDERLSHYLELHGVSAGIERIPPGDLSIGDTLLNLVTDDNIDLMVLGVHIKTKHGHLDMGAICSDLLRQMTVPVLLSH
ncbi:MAG: universal stress protein [Deltaproteobacteria bacterium]|nr:universal stress protein [Deltaproteobacteria bacterium]